jgi:hypothetical protein
VKSLAAELAAGLFIFASCSGVDNEIYKRSCQQPAVSGQFYFLQNRNGREIE